MKRAFLVTTSTVVGVAAVLAYQPNSEVAATMIDITGATLGGNAATTPADVATTSAPEAPTQPSGATADPKGTTAPTPAATTTTKTVSTPAPTKTAVEPQVASTRTLTGSTFDALHGSRSYGQVTVTVTLSGNTMTDISFVQNPAGRNESYITAVRQYLIPAVLQSQSVNVGYVSGATATSEAFAQSLQSALDKG